MGASKTMEGGQGDWKGPHLNVGTRKQRVFIIFHYNQGRFQPSKSVVAEKFLGCRDTPDVIYDEELGAKDEEVFVSSLRGKREKWKKRKMTRNDLSKLLEITTNWQCNEYSNFNQLILLYKVLTDQITKQIRNYKALFWKC